MQIKEFLAGILVVFSISTAIASAEFTCPPNSVPHPYKERCYEAVTTPNFYNAGNRACKAKGGQLAIIPNQLVLNAIKDYLSETLGNEPAFFGLMFKEYKGKWRWNNEYSPLLWTENLIRGPPKIPHDLAGVVLPGNDFKFDWSMMGGGVKKASICEYRSEDDVVINEFCPGDTIMYDNNCYWLDDTLTSESRVDSYCEVRKGQPASFPSNGAIQFLSSVWPHMTAGSNQDPWIGLKYSTNWKWFTGEAETNDSNWLSTAEKDEGAQQSCAVAKLEGESLVWTSEPCGDSRPFLCMGPSGTVLTHQCPTTVCPARSECIEGPRSATCQCLPGFNAQYDSRGRLNCEENAVCQAFGDPHYATWDGGKLHYQGVCKHLLAGPCPQQLPSNLENFEVRVFNDHLPQFSKLVSFTLYTEIIVYGVTVQLGPDTQLLVNGVARTPEITIYPHDDARYIRVQNGNIGLRLFTDFGLFVFFYNRAVTVNAPEDYKNIMCGICGNFNNDVEDDLAHDQEKWIINEDSNRPECQIDDPYESPECTPEIEAIAQNRCGLVHSMQLLEQCKQAAGVEVTGYYDDCMEDSCAIESVDNIDDILCDTMEAIQEVCKGEGYPIDVAYRQVTNCTIDCPANSEYQPFMSYDVATCQNPDAIYDPPSGSGEGCACLTGFVEENGSCIPRQECGCLLDEEGGIYIDRGTSVVGDDCVTVQTCDQNGNLRKTTQEGCIPAAECRPNEQGVYECQCPEGYTGNPRQSCEKDQCPYPMPDGEPGEEGVNSKTDSEGALKINSALKINGVQVDPNRPTHTVMVDPDTWITNPFCQKITCYYGENYDVSEPECVEHADCVLDKNGKYVCKCETGYTGDGYQACDEDTSITGDPHFMVTSHKTGQHLCFDAHGYENDTWSLIKDPVNSLVVNGKLFETKGSTQEHPLSYFSELSVRYGENFILFDRSAITTNGVSYSWGDDVDSDMVHKQNSFLYNVMVSEGITLSVSRVWSDNMGYYLGVYVSHSDGLSEDTTGMIGQFIRTPFEVVHQMQSGPERRGLIQFFDSKHVEVPVILVQRYNQAHKGSVDCWHYTADLKVDALLGNRDQYQLRQITDV